MKLLDIVHPAAKTLVDISMSQDAEVGDGTTSVVMLAGEFLKEAKVRRAPLCAKSLQPAARTYAGAGRLARGGRRLRPRARGVARHLRRGASRRQVFGGRRGILRAAGAAGGRPRCRGHSPRA